MAFFQKTNDESASKPDPEEKGGVESPQEVRKREREALEDRIRVISRLAKGQSREEAAFRQADRAHNDLHRQFRRDIFITRHKKQIYTGFTVALVVALFVVAVYLFFYIQQAYFPPPAPPEVVEQPPASTELEIVSVDFVKSGTDKYDIAARLRNDSLEWGVGALPYVLRLKDGQGRVISEAADTGYILPDETRVLVAPLVHSAAVPASADIVLDPYEWIKLGDVDKMSIDIRNEAFIAPGPDRARVRALAVNRTPYDIEQVDLTVLLYDAKDNLIATNQTNINTFLAGEEREFEVLWFEALPAPFEQMEILPSVNLFDETTILKRLNKGALERYQELAPRPQELY